ncbi:putative phosphorylethanolamine transferase [Scheffersomyces xylosifermentans]|uniref:putative phosphorylethanolamine transferase n=1 Tax=Scheffersomyces xylosifermentans TaxID=1304137 RepID=UPI00315D3166
MYERPEGIENCKIWVDGCFDFAHHGHAGAMLQARQLGKELYAGVHSDEEILHNKGPVVMKLDERLAAVNACKWTTKAIANAPYVTDPKVMDEYDCKYVVHGDDITTDANGEDCYKIMKDMGRFVVVKRTPNISTTDLVGRMLLMSKSHHYKSITDESHPLLEPENVEKFTKYASDQTGLKAGSGVYVEINESQPLKEIVAPSQENAETYKKIYYVDGGFDLFHPGHIEILKLVNAEAKKAGAAVIVGIHDCATINKHKGLNYPIMNLLERSLCVLQCRYVDGVILGAPFSPTQKFLQKLPGTVEKVFHGPTPIADIDPYEEIEKVKDLYVEIGPHKYDDMNTEFIVNRVLNNKKAYEERQRRKGWKSEVELKLREEERKQASQK